MTEKNLVPVTDAEERRAAARRARKERRQRQLATQPGEERSEPAGQRVAQAVAKPKPSPVELDPNAFVLPPRAEIERTTSTFGRIVRWSFVLFVLLPTLLTAAYYALVASEQYATESSFAVRGASSSSAAVDLGGLLSMGGGAGTAETADSFILQEYIHSREMVELLIAEANFLELYSRPSIDPYYRLDPTSPIEDVVSYWQMMSDVDFDSDTGIIALTVRAFRPADAAAVTATVVENSEALINELSLRAREDSVRTAEREVEIAEARFAEARRALASYRGTEKEVDPQATAEARQQVVAELEGELARLNAQLRSLLTTMSPQSPRVVYVQRQIDALRRQATAEQLRVAEADSEVSRPVLTERLSRFEELLAEREFAEKSYISRLATLEAARVEALKQQRYLAVFVRGTTPEESDYPQATRWTLIVFFGLVLSWGVFVLIGAALRDRMS